MSDRRSPISSWVALTPWGWNRGRALWEACAVSGTGPPDDVLWVERFAYEAGLPLPWETGCSRAELLAMVEATDWRETAA